MVPYSQRYLVLGLVGLALWLVSGITLNTVVNMARFWHLNSMYALDSLTEIKRQMSGRISTSEKPVIRSAKAASITNRRSLMLVA